MKQYDFENNKIDSGFNTPERYFERNREILLNQFSEQQKTTTKVFDLKKILTWSSSAAAVLILVSLFLFNRLNTQDQSLVETSKKTLLEDYLIEQGYITDLEIANIFENNELNSLNDTPTFSKQELESYLIEQVELDYFMND